MGSYSDSFGFKLNAFQNLSNEMASGMTHDFLEQPQVWPDRETAHIMRRPLSSAEKQKLSPEKLKEENERVKLRNEYLLQLSILESLEKVFS